MILNEKYKKPHGEIKITMYEKDKVVREIEDHNLIVNSASTLMAGRMAPGAIQGGTGDSGSTEYLEGDYFDHGLQYLAVGTGILMDPTKEYDKDNNPVDRDAYDILNPPEPTLDRTQLTNEVFRKQFTSWNFLNPDGSLSNVATNILQISTTLTEDEANAPLNEVALFGGNSTSEKGSGIMFNMKSFECISKSNNHRISIIWRLTF